MLLIKRISHRFFYFLYFVFVSIALSISGAWVFITLADFLKMSFENVFTILIFVILNWYVDSGSYNFSVSLIAFLLARLVMIPTGLYDFKSLLNPFSFVFSHFFFSFLFLFIPPYKGNVFPPYQGIAVQTYDVKTTVYLPLFAFLLFVFCHCLSIAITHKCKIKFKKVQVDY